MAYRRELVKPGLGGYEEFVDPMELPVIPLRPHLRLLVYPQQVQMRLRGRVRGSF